METISDKDKSKVLELLENDPYMQIWDVSEELRSDPDIVLACAQKDKNAMIIEYAGENLKGNKDFLMQIAKCDENGYAAGLAMVVKYASDTVRNDRQFFIEILQEEGSLYQYIGDSLKNDSDLKLISAISILGEKWNKKFSRTPTFEDKVNKFLSYVKNGVKIPGEEKSRPYSFSVELRNYELSKNFRPGIDDKIQEDNVFVQESPEETKRQIELLERIKGVASDKEENVQTISPLQQRECELASLQAEEKTILEAEALIDKQTEKEGQNIGE